MKIIKVILKKHRTPTETGFEYPDGWDANKINVLAYEDSDVLGDVSEYCIGIVHDDIYGEELLNSAPNEIIEIDEEEANNLGNKYRPPQLFIDQNVLPEILVAITKPDGLRTTKEKSMLDANNDTPGIRTKRFNIRNWFPE